MPRFSKKILLTIIFCALFITTAVPVLAADPYNMLVPFTTEKTIKFPGTTAPIADYIKMIYTYALSIVGILSTIVMMFAGFLWMTAGGNASRVQDAQAWIASALTGLVLALFSYTFLYLINPALVTFKPQPIKNAGAVPVCCKEGINGGIRTPEKKATDESITYSCPSDAPECGNGKTCFLNNSNWICDKAGAQSTTMNACSTISGTTLVGSIDRCMTLCGCSGVSNCYESLPITGTNQLCCRCLITPNIR